MDVWMRKADAALQRAVQCERRGETALANQWLGYALWCERRGR